MGKEIGQLTRKQREFIRHRKEILEIALSLFSEKGFNNVTMHEIAEAAEFSVGTLYKFFTNKEDLYKKLLEDKVSEFYNILMDVLNKDLSEIDKLKLWLDKKYAIFENNKKFIRLYFTEIMGISGNIKAGLHETIRIKYEDMIEQLASLFNDGIKNKKIKKFNSYHLAISFDGISNALLFEFFLSNFKMKKLTSKDILRIFLNKIDI